jgi:dethiobiotin synthase
MRRGFFVTGTDTGVGKTVAAAAFMHRYRRAAPLRYWKPIQTGIERDDDTADVSRLGGCRPDEVLAEGVRLRHPVSPHLAAARSLTSITLPPLVELIRRRDAGGRWLVEGAGGVLVPLNGSETMADLMIRIGLPVVVVARTTLGTINHTLLTLEALRRRSLRVAGVVMIGRTNADNRAAIERLGEVAVLGEMPPFDPLDAETLAKWAESNLDPEGRLLEFLQ